MTLTLDGTDISFEDLKEKAGDAVLTVSYQQQESLPILAVTVLPLPMEGITNLKLENAAVLSELGRQVLVGWAVPGTEPPCILHRFLPCRSCRLELDDDFQHV